MIEWENIPITMRCTCREKIDPRYDPETFWRIEPLGGSPDHKVGRRHNVSRSKYVAAILAALEAGEATTAGLAKAMGVPNQHVYGILGGISDAAPIYERQDGGRILYGVLA